MSVMTIGVVDITQVVGPQLWALPRSIGTLGFLCKMFYTIIVWRVGLLAASLGMIIASIFSSLVLSIPLVVMGAGLLGRIC